ncbi:MAG: site-specific DNA-methyltransferase, partial [Armatimonadetes bacterium]|nr:site-specific DNA-methyltransferase [Armatimonadota bacterium]
HEPEQIKAYRDTWELGIHSYLSYLRDRLLLCRELLADTGSIFVQIGDENVHHVREIMDEVFGPENFVAVVTFRKTGGFQQAALLGSICDFLLWYARHRSTVGVRTLYKGKAEAGTLDDYTLAEASYGRLVRCSRGDKDERVAQLTSLISSGAPPGPPVVLNLWGRRFVHPAGAHWKTSPAGLERLKHAARLHAARATVRYVRFADDFPVVPMTNLWDDTMGEREAVYPVQTSAKVVERCILMTTDPGDVVLDPTCGSGTTAYCAEKWGRRWITCDTSRVALFIARQRLMTAVYDYYELANPEQGPKGGFIYKTVPHITLESIAHNEEIDVIAAEYQPRLDELRAKVNELTGQQMEEWELPRPDEDAAKKWSKPARAALEEYWKVWLEKKQRIDESIRARAPQETLYDQPKVKKGVVRVTGPFTVEAIPVPAVVSPEEAREAAEAEAQAEAPVGEQAGDYIDGLIEEMRKAGINFGKTKAVIENLRRADGQWIHAEGEMSQNGQVKRVAVSFGPKYGPVTRIQVERAIEEAYFEYEILIFAGFAFEDSVTEFLDRHAHPKLEVRRANIAADILAEGLLKTTRASQIFTVYGEPEIDLAREGDKWKLVLRGVDLYDPVKGETRHAESREIAAWFVDTDYDGQSFHVVQAFFPAAVGGKDPWEKLSRTLKAVIDPEVFDQLRGTESLPFEAGEHERVAVKVIDLWGNEVMRVLDLRKQAGDETAAE